MKNVIRLPIGWKQRWQNRMGDRAVVCQVSGRWLQFPDRAEQSGSEQWMIVDVMTLGSNENPKKLCELVLAREDLIHALNHVQPPTK